MLTELPAAVEATWVAATIGSTAVYPFVSALHILGIAVLFGSILPVDLRLLGLTGPQLDEALPTLTRAAEIGFAMVATSGALLASVRLSEYLANPAFLAKMAIVAVAGANALLLRHHVGRRASSLSQASRPMALAAATSLTLWVSAILAGRWIAFV